MGLPVRPLAAPLSGLYDFKQLVVALTHCGTIVKQTEKSTES